MVYERLRGGPPPYKNLLNTGEMIKSFETRRLRTFSARGGEKVIIRARESKEEKPISVFKQTLKVMFHIIKCL